MEQGVGGAASLIIAILLWLMIGLVIGLIARFLLPGPDPASVSLTILFGMVGSLVGGFIARALGLTSLMAWIPIIGVAVLAVWLNRKRTSRRVL